MQLNNAMATMMLSVFNIVIFFLWDGCAVLKRNQLKRLVSGARCFVETITFVEFSMTRLDSTGFVSGGCSRFSSFSVCYQSIYIFELVGSGR